MTRLAAQFVIFVLFSSGATYLWAQTPDTTAQNPNGAPPAAQNSSGAPPAATGLDTSTQMSENPPVSGLDQPRFEPGFGARSYLAPSVEVDQAIDSNAAGDFSSTNLTASTRALGSVDLQKLWKLHPLDLGYIGGVDWYSGANGHVYQVHALDATQRFLWRTGQLALRDTFSYLPEGAFGFGSFGGAGGVFGDTGGIPGSVTEPGIFTNGQFGSIGTQPRINNMGIADITQYLSPRSAVVLTGGYGVTDFLDNPQTPSCSANPGCYFNSQMAIGQVAYNHQISRRDQIALVYAYEEIHFRTSLSGSINVNLLQLVYGHRISGKLDFLIAGGPELVRRAESQEELLGQIPLGLPCTTTGGALLPCVTTQSKFITGSARLALRYHVSARTDLELDYLRYINPGSGFYGGAQTDAVHFAADHRLARRWTVMCDSGYARNSRLLTETAGIAAGTSSFDYWYVGGAVHRVLGRNFGAFASYQFNEFGFANSGCTTTAGNCGRNLGRNIFLLGVHWTPHPIRLD
jgi:hypothetical protein